MELRQTETREAEEVPMCLFGNSYIEYRPGLEGFFDEARIQTPLGPWQMTVYAGADGIGHNLDEKPNGPF